jgi:predicted RNase H-like nuclease
MYFIGVDLAWGERKPTGVAVLDDGGRLVHLGVAGDDASILALLGPYAEGDCLVAIDAPLVVTNPSGNRRCEAELNRDFRAFDAGAHPSNTSRPWFADGGRGARLTRALDLNATSRRQAIEVYPHAASVALFHLDRTLKYKQKQGRDTAQLKRELLRLIELIETLRDADPPLRLGPDWHHIRQAVADATRKFELRRAEDPVDAVICAYVALYAKHRPDDVTTYGEPDSGCIVTPSLRHEDHGRQPKSIAPTQLCIDGPVRQPPRKR